MSFQSDLIYQSIFELIHTDDRAAFRCQLHQGECSREPPEAAPNPKPHIRPLVTTRHVASLSPTASLHPCSFVFPVFPQPFPMDAAPQAAPSTAALSASASWRGASPAASAACWTTPRGFW